VTREREAIRARKRQRMVADQEARDIRKKEEARIKKAKREEELRKKGAVKQIITA